MPTVTISNYRYKDIIRHLKTCLWNNVVWLEGCFWRFWPISKVVCFCMNLYTISYMYNYCYVILSFIS